MHPNPAFRQAETARALAFARERGFGALSVSAGAGAPLMAHVPFLLSSDGARAELHLMRSNPVARAVGAGVEARLAVLGPDGYVSPDWYGVPDQVPTWNYVAVHLVGRLRPLPAEHMHALLDRQSAEFERRLAPKPPWTSAKMSEGVMARMMRGILPFVIEVSGVESTFKLNQNKPEAARRAAAARMGRDGVGSETAELARLMRDPPA